MGTIAPINFEKSVIATIDTEENSIVAIDFDDVYMNFDWKRGCKESLHPLIKVSKEVPDNNTQLSKNKYGICKKMQSWSKDSD